MELLSGQDMMAAHPVRIILGSTVHAHRIISQKQRGYRPVGNSPIHISASVNGEALVKVGLRELMLIQYSRAYAIGKFQPDGAIRVAMLLVPDFADGDSMTKLFRLADCLQPLKIRTQMIQVRRANVTNTFLRDLAFHPRHLARRHHDILHAGNRLLGGEPPPQRWQATDCQMYLLESQLADVDCPRGKVPADRLFA